MSSRNSAIIEPSPVQETFATMTDSTSPSEEPVASLHSPDNSSSNTSFRSHGKTLSLAAESLTSAGPRSNRFSISFPVYPSASASPVRMPSPNRETPPASLFSFPGASDGNFLTAIAAQERRVLELREELVRAEADLHRLKREWAQHEAQKKRDDARRGTKLQPLQTSLPVADKEDDTDGSSAWMQAEMERRKALMNQSKTGNRTVFAGSRHTKTLSLLSPDQNSAMLPLSQTSAQFPNRKDSLSESVRQSHEFDRSQPRPKALSRTSTAPDLSIEFLDKGIDRDVLLKTGKKMATDLRDGLWTFWEDLKQTTVGEEGNPANSRVTTSQRHPPRRSSSQNLGTIKPHGSRNELPPSSRGSKTTTPSSAQIKRSKSISKPSKTPTSSLPSMAIANAPALADPSFWTEHGFHASPPPAAAAVKKTPKSERTRKALSNPASEASVSSDNTAWETWDTPRSATQDFSPKASRSSSAGSSSETNTVPTTGSSTPSPRPSTDAKSASTKLTTPDRHRDPIPWPALSNLGPKALRRTASHLMSEWEKSLTPSPGDEFTGDEDYLGLGAEAAATSRAADAKQD